MKMKFTELISDLAKSRLSIRLFIYVIICSVFFSLAASVFQLWFNYQSNIKEVHDNLDFIETSYLPSLSKGVYDLNDEQVKIQLNGILK